jgi:hypothetical protein
MAMSEYGETGDLGPVFWVLLFWVGLSALQKNGVLLA